MLFVSCVAALIIAGIVIGLVRKRQRHPFPPGPKGLPVIGNVHQVPSDHTWLTFMKWAEQYGEIFYISMFGKHTIVLNSPKAAIELLENRGAIYSDRPRMVMAGDIVGYSNTISLSQYGAHHRDRRKLIFETFGPRKIAQFQQFEEEQTQKLLPLLLNSPKEFHESIKTHVGSVIFFISHDYKVTGPEDPFLNLAERANGQFIKMVSPGAFLVDVLPILRFVPAWFPFAHFQRLANIWRKDAEDLRDLPYNYVKERFLRGEAGPSFTANLLRRKPEITPEEDLDYRWISSSIYGAAVDTVTTCLDTFLLLMMRYPDAQKKAQAEIDTFIGTSRLPSFGDRPHLQYVEAICKEVMRMHPVTPLGVPHVSTTDDVYGGYHIPAGSTIIANQWAILHDPITYPEPYAFKPERYLSSKSQNINPDPRKFVFGHGRRICPGQHLANDEYFIAVAMILSVFTISPPEKSGLKEVGFTSGLVSFPEPFECSFSLRTPEAATLVNKEV